MPAEKKYSELKEKCQAQVAAYSRAINRISNLRLLVFLLGISLAIVFLIRKNYGWFVFDLVLFLALFIYLVVIHETYFKKKKYWQTLEQINQEALLRLRGEWADFPDDGGEFWDENHSYSQDLDLFGKNSLFQFLNTAGTYFGRLKLKEFLASPSLDPDEISLRQEAVLDLAPRLDFRQRLTAESRLAGKMFNPEKLLDWVKTIDLFYRKPAVVLLGNILPALTILIGIVTLLRPQIGYYALIAALLIQFILLKAGAKKRNQALETASAYAENIRSYAGMLSLLESEPYASRYLAELKDRFKSLRGETACAQIARLGKIVEAVANRRSQLYFIFNLIFLLDYRFMFALEKWKEKSGSRLSDWLKVIGEFEALASLAVLPHDHPEWAVPELVVVPDQGSPVFCAEGMAHPLLKNGVANDLKFGSPQTGSPENILIITGSNMSGKSTLLRTAGLNLVLAYAGTAVCAEKFRCSPMELYTCMRVKDNLEQNISSFYAELLRIKMIVRAVEAGKVIFFLLDEIFKGTNSIDRHAGAKALLKTLSKSRLLGLISTHDLELGDLAKENNRIKNYHFQEYYLNDQIRFDYKLKPGVSRTRNAAYLMKMAGITMEETD